MTKNKGHSYGYPVKPRRFVSNKHNATKKDKETPASSKWWKIYTDGGCNPNPGPGGWGFLFETDQESIERWGCKKATTNNEMEMTALIEALKFVCVKAQAGQSVLVLTDSMYVVHGTNIWRHGWKQRGWTKKGGETPSNLKLWKEIDELMSYVLLSEIKVQVKWVKGHAATVGNLVADDLATRGVKEAQETVRKETFERISREINEPEQVKKAKIQKKIIAKQRKDEEDDKVICLADVVSTDWLSARHKSIATMPKRIRGRPKKKRPQTPQETNKWAFLMNDL